jgi:ATP-dependent RNA helicase SUPV3L1/SUV3
MGDRMTIHRYERLTPLAVAEKSLEGDLGRIEDGDCVVCFSRSGIFATKKAIEQKTGKRCAVVYGALPPETRSEQAKLFNEKGSGVDVMVASDAVGMGLNL